MVPGLVRVVEMPDGLALHKVGLCLFHQIRRIPIRQINNQQHETCLTVHIIACIVSLGHHTGTRDDTITQKLYPIARAIQARSRQFASPLDHGTLTQVSFNKAISPFKKDHPHSEEHMCAATAVASA